MAEIVAHIGLEHYKTIITSDKHSLIADEPPEDGGTDLGFSPYDLASSALAACTAITLRMYADRKQWDLTGVEVNVEFDQSSESGPMFTRKISLSGDLTEEQQQRLLLIANACPVHKLLTTPTVINSHLE